MNESDQTELFNTDTHLLCAEVQAQIAAIRVALVAFIHCDHRVTLNLSPFVLLLLNRKVSFDHFSSKICVLGSRGKVSQLTLVMVAPVVSKLSSRKPGETR